MPKARDLNIVINVDTSAFKNSLKKMEEVMKITKPQLIVNESVATLKADRFAKMKAELQDMHEDFHELEEERKDLFAQLKENHKKEEILMKTKRAIELETAYYK
jgi:hypothetical protein